MKNEFDMPLDRNGYAESIMQRREGVCWLCGRSWGAKLDRHEPWGAANRQKSKELGLWVNLCHFGCHEGPGSVHEDGSLARELRKDAQRAAMLRYGWTREEFIARFGKSELSEEECRHLIIMPKEQRTETCGEERRERSEGAGARRTVGDLVAELFPDQPTNTRGFRVLNDAPLPF